MKSKLLKVSLFAILATTLTLISCKKEDTKPTGENTNYSELIIGEWIMNPNTSYEKLDGPNGVHTYYFSDEGITATYIFNEDGSMSSIISNSEEDNASTYSIDGNNVTIGEDTFTIITLNEEMFIFERSEDYKSTWTVHYECKRHI